MRALNNITGALNRLGANAGKPAGLPGVLRNKFLFLWTGGYTGDDLKDSLGSAAVITVTGKDWTTRYIDPDTSATFAVPDNATFIGADGTDDFWFDASDTLQQKTHAELIASETLRTFIKYADFEPYFVYGIGILKAGETLTDGDKVKLNRYFKLWAEYWGVLMDSGYMKDNRIVDESWSSYWATLISATVEQAAPTNVVLTFPTAQTSLGATDFTIAGFTISSASWTGAVLTLILSTAVNYGDSVVISFVPSGGTATATNNVTHPLVIEDGNTVGWYLSSDLSTITKNAGTDEVTAWTDKLSSGHNFNDPGANYRPIWSADGILFDGIDDKLKTSGFTFVQPEFIYIVFKQVTWTLNKVVFDGSNASLGELRQSAISPEIRAVAPLLSDEAPEMPIGSFNIVRVLFNGSSSKIRIKNELEYTFNCGTNNMGGITLGAWGNGTSRFSNIQVKEVIARKIADSDENEGYIYNYLRNRHSISDSALNPFDNGKLVLSFDDGTASQYSSGASVLQAKNVRATMYVNTDYIGTAGYMTWANLIALHGLGFDLECHTKDGANLAGLTSEQITANLQAVDTAFTSNGLPVPKHLAYPLGVFNADVKTTVSALRLTGRKTGSLDSPRNNYTNTDKFELTSIAIDNISDAGVIRYKKILDNVQRQKGATIAYSHGVSVDGSATEISIAHLEEIIDYAISIGMDIVTVDQLYALMD